MEMKIRFLKNETISSRVLHQACVTLKNGPVSAGFFPQKQVLDLPMSSKMTADLPEKPLKKPAKRQNLTPEEFEELGAVLLSTSVTGHGWKRAFIAGTGLSASNLTRYKNGEYPIPLWVGTMFEMIATLRSNGLPLPEAFDRWQT